MSLLILLAILSSYCIGYKVGKNAQQSVENAAAGQPVIVIDDAHQRLNASFLDDVLDDVAAPSKPSCSAKEKQRRRKRNRLARKSRQINRRKYSK